MSHSNFNPKLYQPGDLQFQIVSKSHQNYNPGSANSATASDYGHPGSGHLPHTNHQKLNQIVMNDTSDIFNDGIEGGGVEPSINESIRQSIQYSFVSSECGEEKQKYQESQSQDAQRNNWVMNRMNWITFLKVLFDQLETFNQNKQKHVETTNFLRGLKRIKPILPLLTRNEYYKNSSEVAFTYKEVEIGVTKMPKYITWDNVIDIFLSKSFATSTPTSNARTVQGFQQLSSEDLYQQPQQIDESQLSDGYYEEVDVEQSCHDRYSDNRGGRNRKQTQVINRTANVEQKPAQKRQNEDFYPSFADSLINIGHTNFENHNANQQIIAQAPLLGGPNLGLKDKDDDEACEIDSEYSEEESKNNSHSRRQRSKLEESIRSSRTATFKSIRRTSTYQTAANLSNQFNHHSQLTSALSQAVNVQDSYYQQIKNSSMPQNYQSQSNQQQLYYKKQQSNHSKNDSKHSQHQYYDNEDGQVEVASNHSFGSSKQWKTMDNGINSSLRGDIFKSEDQMMPQEKSTRISSLNSATKIPTLNQNNTILSQESSQSSQAYLKNHNNSKLSTGKNSTSTISQLNYVDLDLQGKGLKNFEIDYKTGSLDRRQLRSVNFANNNLIKLPTGLEKSLQFMNVSYNKLKSLNGIESCVNLKFLNVAGNQLSSANNLVLLQSMRELVFSFNQLSLLKEIGQLKNLTLLDLSFNKIIEFEKLTPLQNLKKLTILSLQGNLMHKVANYEAVVNRMLPHVKVQDPDQIRDFSQYQTMEHVCFTDPPENHNASQMIMVEQLSQMNLRQLNSSEKENENKQRSRTPNRDRPRSQLGKQVMDSKLKSTVISPQRTNMEAKIIVNAPKSPNVNQRQQNKNQMPSSGRPSTAAAQNQSQFKLQGKYQSTSSGQTSIIPNKITKGNLSQRNSTLPQSSQTRDRSYTGEQVNKKEENKIQGRDRSISNLSRNTKQQHFQSSGQVSGRSTAQQSQSNMPLQHQMTNQSVKEPQVKKIALNPNLVKTYGSQGKITPRRNNLQTPRQEQETHYYKKSFCTEEENSMVHNDLQNTPSEKNTIRTAPTQDSSDKKQRGVRNVIKKDDLTLQSANVGILSPNAKVYKAPTIITNNRTNNTRPVTTLKQRVMVLAQKDLGVNNTATTNSVVLSQQSVSMIQGNNRLGMMPQSTKNNSNFSQSFVFDQQLLNNKQGRQTPTQSQLPSSRPSSQLQKFITASNKQSTQANNLSNRPSIQTPSSVMSVHAIPSQKLTNLPPRAYQSKTGNPGDKKSKADMSLSMISQGNNSNLNNQLGNNSNNSYIHHQANPSNSSIVSGPQIKNSSQSILQTGSHMHEDESHIDSISSRSMSPVLEESNNIKKLKVDLTQFMNKQ